MIVFYNVLLAVLSVLKEIIRLRAAVLEGKYARAARETDVLSREASLKSGNNKQDFLQTTKRQFILGNLVQRRDRLEAKHDRWQRLSESVGHTVSWLRGWQGRKLPYTLGVVDVTCFLYFLNWWGGGGNVNVKGLVETAHSLVAR